MAPFPVQATGHRPADSTPPHNKGSQAKQQGEDDMAEKINPTRKRGCKP